MMAAVYFMKPVNKVDPFSVSAMEHLLLILVDIGEKKQLNELLINIPAGRKMRKLATARDFRAENHCFREICCRVCRERESYNRAR